MKDQQIVFVTGAAQGIGYEISRKFAEQGAKIVLTDLNAEAVKASANELRTKGFEAIGMKCDVTKEEEIKQVIDRAVSSYGTVDVLINNAGLQHVSNIEEFPTEKFELLIKVMLTAPFILTKHVLPLMKKQRFGRIINMASINGLVGFAGKAAYNSAKHGVIGLTKVTALEVAVHGITVNAICPGYVDTPLVRNQLADLAKTRGVEWEKVLDEVIYPLVPQRRLLTVDEISSYAIFLASEAAKGITGQSIVIDGGYTVQ